jgi:hypothetical protein
MTTFPATPPQGVVLQYADGTQAPLDALLYLGLEPCGDDGTAMHVWEGVDPLPEKPLAGLCVDMLPARTRVQVV